ncbi:MAG: transposase, partial [Dehalococcoidales bacterium]|nr:transposase [Dehalococcoidales bacterium]
MIDFNDIYPDENSCLEWLIRYRYPKGIQCRVCGAITPHSKLSKRQAYVCNRCGNHVYPKAGTIFERSSTPLKSWLYIIFLICKQRQSISPQIIQKQLGVTYKTAWRMFKKIRLLIRNDPDLIHSLFSCDNMQTKRINSNDKLESIDRLSCPGYIYENSTRHCEKDTNNTVFSNNINIKLRIIYQYEVFSRLEDCAL